MPKQPQPTTTSSVIKVTFPAMLNILLRKLVSDFAVAKHIPPPWNAEVWDIDGKPALVCTTMKIPHANAISRVCAALPPGLRAKVYSHLQVILSDDKGRVLGQTILLVN
jgi:hypothetical protein